MSEVAGLIIQARQAPVGASALEAVMGKDWAELKHHRPARAAHMEFVVGRTAARRRPLVPIGRQPQAMVKLVTKGGVGNKAGLAAQLAYLSREGRVAVHRSERHMGIELDEDGVETLAVAWSLRTGQGAIDRTTHFVVSFPHGTDTAAADRAGRAWAEEAFGSGRFGDRWDYYTVHHHDTGYPHTHVVVSRRGLERGDWLKVSPRGELTFDRLRELQVVEAGREGIALEATPRLARGLHERPIPDAEYRRAWEETRAGVAREHNDWSAIITAAVVVGFARQYEADAALVEATDPATAAAFREAAGQLAQGHSIAPHARTAGGLIDDTDNTRETRPMGEVREDTVQVAEREIREARRELEGVADPAERERLGRALDAESRALASITIERGRESQTEETGEGSARQGLEVASGGTQVGTPAPIGRERGQATGTENDERDARPTEVQPGDRAPTNRGAEPRDDGDAAQDAPSPAERERAATLARRLAELREAEERGEDLGSGRDHSRSRERDDGYGL